MNDEIERLKAELAHCQQQIWKLERRDEQSARFLAGLNHDLRAPMANIKGFAQVLLTEDKIDSLTPLQRDYVESIFDLTTYCVQVINDYLDVLDSNLSG